MRFQNFFGPVISLRRIIGLMSLSLMSLSFMSMTGCLLAAAGAGGEAAYVLTQSDRTASETLVDQRITTAVKSKLLADQTVSGFDINVDSFKSVVTLKGVVDSETERTTALELARTTPGVKDVKSKLVVIE